jgi:hydroxyacylglutathione hydrolase
MAVRLKGNVYQVGGKNLTHPLDAASYLILDPNKEEHVLIDCGMDIGFAQLKEQVGSLGVDIGKIAIMMATHGHDDHVSGSAHMPECTIYIHDKDLDGIATANPYMTAAYVNDREFPILNNDIVTIEDGFEITVGDTNISTIHTPGHTLGSVCYKVTTPEASICVGGDTIWGHYSDEFKSDIQLWGESLIKLQNKDFDYVTFGHDLDRLVPDANKYLDRAAAQFNLAMENTHGGKLINIWGNDANGLKKAA